MSTFEDWIKKKSWKRRVPFLCKELSVSRTYVYTMAKDPDRCTLPMAKEIFILTDCEVRMPILQETIDLGNETQKFIDETLDTLNEKPT